jgi:hypothetical protein
MAPQPTNPGQSPPDPQPSGGIQLPNFASPRAAKPTNLGPSPPPIPPSSPQKTWQAPRLHQGEPISQTEQSPITDDFRKPLKRVGLALGAVFIAILLISFIYNAVAGMFQKVLPQASPVVASSPALAPVNASPDACTGMSAKMKTARVSGKQVDRVFWQKHPDRVNKTLDLSAAADRELRQEWCQIAGELTAKP